MGTRQKYDRMNRLETRTGFCRTICLVEPGPQHVVDLLALHKLRRFWFEKRSDGLLRSCWSDCDEGEAGVLPHKLAGGEAGLHYAEKYRQYRPVLLRLVVKCGRIMS